MVVSILFSYSMLFTIVHIFQGPQAWLERLEHLAEPSQSLEAQAPQTLRHFVNQETKRKEAKRSEEIMKDLFEFYQSVLKGSFEHALYQL